MYTLKAFNFIIALTFGVILIMYISIKDFIDECERKQVSLDNQCTQQPHLALEITFLHLKF